MTAPTKTLPKPYQSGKAESCPCDTCRFKKDNYNPPNQCPNFEYFFDAMMTAFDGVLKTDECEKWEAEE